MEDVIFLGCIGTISSSWHASPAKGFIEFNGYGKINHKICLRPGRKGDFWAAFFLIGLLGELVWHLFVRSEIPLSNKFFWYCNDCCAFSRKFLMHSLSVSSFSISLLHLKHNREDASCSFSRRIPNTEDNLAATFCFFEVSPSNRTRVMHRCITRDHMSFLSGLIRYMIRNLHGIEALSSCEQRFIFLLGSSRRWRGFRHDFSGERKK